MKDAITIGIPIRNEELSLPSFLVSLEHAVRELRSGFPRMKFEIIFCINNTTDRSEEILKQFSASTTLSPHVFIIKSAPGKMHAIKSISCARTFKNGMLCFADADVVLDSHCLASLVNTINLNPNVFLAYARVKANFIGRMNLIERLQNAHYVLRERISPRKHFHGRAYLMRTGALLDRKINIAEDDKNWKLKDGPYIDDVYFSRILAHELGVSSIKEDGAACVSFIPPRNLSDFYFGQRRLLLEIKRLNLLNPEHGYTQREFFRKHIDWGKLRGLSIKLIMQYVGYHLLEDWLRLFIHLEIFLISVGLIKFRSHWEILKTTKLGVSGAQSK